MAKDGNRYFGLLVQDDAMFSEYYGGDIVITKFAADVRTVTMLSFPQVTVMQKSHVFRK